MGIGIKNRYLVFSAWECHEPMKFEGGFSSFSSIRRKFRPRDKNREMVEVYDTLKERKRCLWNGMDLSFLSKENGGNREPYDAPSANAWSGWVPWT